MSKPQEWWIDFDESDYLDDCKVYSSYPGTPRSIHVIERSAYVELEAKLKRTKDALHAIRYSFKMNEQERLDLAEQVLKELEQDK